MDSKVPGSTAKELSSLENEEEWPKTITSSPLVHTTKDRPKRNVRKPSSRSQSGMEAEGNVPHGGDKSYSISENSLPSVEEVNKHEVPNLQEQKSSVSAVHSPPKEKALESFQERLKMVRKSRDTKRVSAGGMGTPETSTSRLSALNISVTSPSTIAASTFTASDSLPTACTRLHHQ